MKSIVCGHVRYAPEGSAVTLAEVGLDVNIFYGQKDDNGNVDYALKTVKTRQGGYFETTLGCPVGQTLEVKVECCGQSKNNAKDDKGSSSSVQAYFHAEVAKTLTCGTAAYFKMDMKLGCQPRRCRPRAAEMSRITLPERLGSEELSTNN